MNDAASARPEFDCTFFAPVAELRTELHTWLGRRAQVQRLVRHDPSLVFASARLPDSGARATDLSCFSMTNQLQTWHHDGTTWLRNEWVVVATLITSYRFYRYQNIRY